MDRILALLDGSVYSESVCHHAAWIAARLKCSVDALHVIGRREGAATEDLSGTLSLGAHSALLAQLSELDAQRAKLAQSRGHAILEDARSILKRDGVRDVQLRMRTGDLLEAVQDNEQGFRAIIIGKRGEAANFASGHLGSNLERIVRSSRVPVFVAARAFKPIETVLLAYDGSASAKTAVERMGASALYKDLAITVLTIGQDQQKAKAMAEQAVARLKADGLDAKSRVASGEAEEVIERIVREDGFDLLVMGAYGHSRIRSLIIGSTTTAMIRSVTSPVLLYRQTV